LETKTPQRVHWPAVIFFYVVACAIAWPLFWWRDRLQASWAAWPVPEAVKTLLPALGPALGALLALAIFRKHHRRTVSFAGTSWRRSLLFAAIPSALVVAVGVGQEQPHLTALFFVEVHIVYAVCEELGWRGFLQDALAPLPPRRRFVLIGVLWGFWQLTTYAYGGLGPGLVRFALMFVVWIGGSWGIGRAVDRSRSLVVAAMLHLVIVFGENLTTKRGLFVLVLSGAAWLYLLWTWPPPDQGAGIAAVSTRS
jgi:membrane protease YdiL (CAAX protease family)